MSIITGACSYYRNFYSNQQCYRYIPVFIAGVRISLNPKPMVYNILRLDFRVIITSTMLLLYCCFTQQ
jgi:hypothetical protein